MIHLDIAAALAACITAKDAGLLEPEESIDQKGKLRYVIS